MARTVPLVSAAAGEPPKTLLRQIPDLLRRLVAAMADTYRRRAEREASFYLEISQMKLPAMAEREIKHRFPSPRPFHLD